MTTILALPLSEKLVLIFGVGGIIVITYLKIKFFYTQYKTQKEQYEETKKRLNNSVQNYKKQQNTAVDPLDTFRKEYHQYIKNKRDKRSR